MEEHKKVMLKRCLSGPKLKTGYTKWKKKRCKGFLSVLSPVPLNAMLKTKFTEKVPEKNIKLLLTIISEFLIF